MQRRTMIKSAALLSAATMADPLLAAKPAATPAPPKSKFAFTTRPILQEATPCGASIFIGTSRAAACHVELAEGKGKFLPITSERHGLTVANTTVHHLALDMLKPATKYRYRIVGREITSFGAYKVKFGQTITSEPFEFTTPDPAAKTVRFSMLNDIHKNRDLLDTLLTGAETFKPELLFLNGDILSHLNGAADVEYIYSTKSSLPSTTPYHWIRGNHECRGAYARELPKFILAAPDRKFYYTFRQGPVQFAVLDCGEDKPDDHWAYSGLNSFDAYRKREAQWLERLIQTPQWKSAPFRVCLCHIPIQISDPKSDRHRPWTTQFSKILSKGKLDLNLAGHTHRYAYLAPSGKDQSFHTLIGGAPKLSQSTLFNAEATATTLTITALPGESSKPPLKVLKIKKQ